MFPLPFVILAGLSSPVTAQVEHPNRATGSRSETLYSSSGSDDVNLFNGGLTWRIPVGERVSVGPLLSIAPTLVYNNRTTRPWRTCRDDMTDHNVGDRAIGSGWQLHFGRLVPVHDRPPYSHVDCNTAAETSSAVTGPDVGMRSTRWGYQAPDGAVHEFYDRRTELTCHVANPGCEPSPPPNCFSPDRPAGHCFVYTHDGSFLRLDPRDPERGGLPTVYFPDGTWQVLGFAAGRRPAAGGSSALTDLDFADQHPDSLAAHRGDPPVSHATLIGDRFGNRITVQYYGDGTPGSPPHPLEAQGVPANQRDAIPYRAFPSASASPWEPLSPSKVYRFDVETVSYQPDPRNPPVVAPRLTAIVVPTSVPDGAGGWRTATWALEHSYWPTPSDGPRLSTLHLPTLQGQDALSYSFTYGFPARLAEVRLPTLAESGTPTARSASGPASGTTIGVATAGATFRTS